MKTSLRMLLVVVVALSFSACSPKSPVLYPNKKFKAVGEDRAEEDRDKCMEMAEDAGAKGDSHEMKAAKTAGRGAAAGAATGAAFGAIYNGKVGRGAAAGGVGGGVGSFFWNLFSPPEPDPVFKRYVEICLAEKGYKTVGWK